MKTIYCPTTKTIVTVFYYLFSLFSLHFVYNVKMLISNGLWTIIVIFIFFEIYCCQFYHKISLKVKLQSINLHFYSIYLQHFFFNTTLLKCIKHYAV